MRAGHSYAAAARAGGIDEATLLRWLSRGRDGEEPYRGFCRRFDEADHAAENRAVEVVTSRMESSDPKVALAAAQWWLTRRRVATWGDKPVEGKVAEETQAGDDMDLLRSLMAAAESRKAG